MKLAGARCLLHFLVPTRHGGELYCSRYSYIVYVGIRSIPCSLVECSLWVAVWCAEVEDFVQE